jgi:hypothetical protein
MKKLVKVCQTLLLILTVLGPRWTIQPRSFTG